MGQRIGRYSVTAVGATSVTLTPVAGREDADLAGDPAILGTGTIVITQGVTPSARWVVGHVYLVEFSRVD